jgi:predicted neutral ceramidase superfamily lipid hydrolase
MMAKLFDRIAQAITSLGAVVFVMLMTITGMIFFSHTLFNQVFPGTMDAWEKLMATWVMALGWEFTVLITTVNTKHINKHIPAIMAACSGIIVLFFIQAFGDELSWLQLMQRWFVGILVATINYIYAELFYAKWQERQTQQALPLQVTELSGKLIERERNVIDLQWNLNEAQSKMVQIESELKELRELRKRMNEELTCPHCQVVQANHNTLRAHKGHCSENPINKNQN